MKNGKNSITGSPSSMSLIKFTEEQDSLAHRMQMLVADQNLLNKADKEDAINFQRAVADLYKITQERFRNFADSVSSSAAFMKNFDHIDFENDFTGMKHLVDNAMKRFPNAAGISRLDSQVSKLIHILEKELKIGDVFPSLQLPDFDGHLYSTDSNKGKFVFIDFWSSWCPNCMIYDKVRQNIKEDNHFGNLVLIHVALDDHVSLCREIVETNKMSGVQLIDTDIWQGQTSEKLAFDSIPFNFLLSPDHHILAKGIPADSILPLLRKYIR
jgi:thiol-disulfide isomerase/thioredoxin